MGQLLCAAGRVGLERVAGVSMIWCRCNAHLVESDDDQTPDETCCVCRGKRLRAARLRWYAAGHRNAEKPNAPDCSEASTSRHPAAHLRHGGRIAMTMPDARRNVKPENTPPRAAGGSDGDRLQA